MGNSEIARYAFRVQEGLSAYDVQHWLTLEPVENDLSIFARGYLSLRLSQGLTLGQAQALAQYLNNSVSGVSYTSARPEAKMPMLSDVWEPEELTLGIRTKAL